MKTKKTGIRNRTEGGDFPSALDSKKTFLKILYHPVPVASPLIISYLHLNQDQAIFLYNVISPDLHQHSKKSKKRTFINYFCEPSF